MAKPAKVADSRLFEQNVPPMYILVNEYTAGLYLRVQFYNRFHLRIRATQVRENFACQRRWFGQHLYIN